ncbi:low voltage-gated calcium channel [Aureococcus anophagefferens]|uniref:Low voltage-gated calcium channel n=1 Tax=Aureococcus anophagefferens TaxID=44056 RepID=A0ABR1G160_AURAN
MIYKVKKARETDEEEEEDEILDGEIINEQIKTNPVAVLEKHEQRVFGEDENATKNRGDYYWYEESTTTGYMLPWDEGLYSFPVPWAVRCICFSHVQLVRDARFEMIVNGTIGLVAVALTLHLINKPDLSKPSSAELFFFVTLVKFLSLFVFAAEMVVKIVAEGTRPLRYWTGPESGINTFDSTIVILSFALMGGGGGEAILPVLRLARLVKLLNRSPETRRVLYGIIAGFRAMASIVVLLTMILFLYAIIGVKSFGENDPAHFGTLPVAMLTLFVASTLSDWSHMMAINYKGCDKGGEDWGYVLTDELTKFETAVGRFYNYDCYDPTPRKFDAIVYFYSFTLLTAFVVLNLFISAIDMAMFDILYADKVEEHAENAEKDEGAAPPPVTASRRMSFADPQAMVPGAAIPGKRASILAEAGLAGTATKRASILADAGLTPSLAPPPERKSSTGLVGGLSAAATNLKRGSIFDMVRMGPMGGRKSIAPPKTAEEMCTQMLEGPEKENFDAVFEQFFEPRISKLDEEEEDLGALKPLVTTARWICNGHVFPTIVVVCILIAGLIEAFAIDPEEPVDEDTLALIDTSVLGVFCVECVLKILACGRAPYRYFADSWNVFDFVIVCISVLGMIPAAADSIPGVAMLRLLRLLKLVNFYPALNVAVSSIIKASANIFYAAIVLVLVVYVYAVIGILIFRVNDPGHFGTLHQAIAAVWAVCTTDGWDVIMYTNMYGCVRFGYPFNEVECANSRSFGWIAAFYFTSLVLVGAWMLPTVIIGITTIAFAESTEEIKEEYAQLKMALDVAKKAAVLFDTPCIGPDIVPLFHGVYMRMAEEQVKAKMLEFRIETTQQQEGNGGLRDFMMRPLVKYLCANYLTGLLPPNRTRLSDDKCNAIFEAACADYWKEAKCPWPTFLFLLNFLKCSAMYMPDEAEGDEEFSDEDESDRGAPKKRMSQRLSALGSAIWGSQKTEPRSKKKKKKRKKKKEKTTPEPLAEETKIPDPFGDVAGAGLAEAQHLNELARKAPVLGETMEFLEETEKGLETELVGVGTPSKAAQRQSLVAQFFCGETDPEGRANAPGDFPASPFCSGGRGGAGDAPAEDPPAPPKQ